MRPSRLCTAGLLSVLAMLFLSCGPREDGVLPREDLFTLGLGKSENAMDVFTSDGIRSQRKDRICMQNGLFYIVNGNSSKVMKLSSYGDLLGLVQNPQVNPLPVLLDESAAGKVSNRSYRTWAFEDPGEIAVTNDGTMLVEDILPESQWVSDEELGTSLNRVVLRFDNKGTYRDSLGQEGIGGAPFPWIQWMAATPDGRVTIQCRSPRAWTVYGFDPQGHRQYLLTITPDTLPVPSDGDWMPSLATIRPDLSGQRIFVLMQYYDRSETSLRPGSKVSEVQERVYTLDLSSGTWESWFSLPREDQVAGRDRTSRAPRYQSLHQFLGATNGDYLYFLSRESQDWHVMEVFDRQGRSVSRHRIQLEDSKIMDMDFHLSPSGVLSVMAIGEDSVHVSWWRTDGQGRTDAPGP